MDSTPVEIEVRMPQEAAPAPLLQPRGIYLLDKAAKLKRINLCNLPYIDGFAWRPDWTDFLDEFGGYDFDDIQEAVVRLQAMRKKLSVYIEAEEVPGFVYDTAIERYVAKKKGPGGVFHYIETSAPWDRPSLDRYQVFIQQLSNVPCLDTSVTPHRTVPFRDHPTLAVLRVSPIGRTHFARDLYDQLQAIQGFTRARYIAACIETLTIVQDAFPSTPLHIGFFELKEIILLPPPPNSPPGTPMKKVEIQPPFDYALARAITDRFNNIDRPGIGVFEELLTKRKPKLDSRYSDNLMYCRHRGSYVAFQAIDCWAQPFSGNDFVRTDELDGTTPFPAIAHGLDDYGARYFEMYPPDLTEMPAWVGQWNFWHGKIWE